MYHCPCFKNIFGSIFCMHESMYMYISLSICTCASTVFACNLFIVVERGDQCRERGELPGWRQRKPQGRNLNSLVPLRQGVWWMSLLYGFATKPPYFGFGLPTCLSCFFLKMGTFIANPVWWAPCFWWINRLLKASWQGRKSFKFGTKIPTPIFPRVFFPLESAHCSMAKGSSDDDNDDKLFVAHELAFKYSAGRRRRWYKSNNWKVCRVDARCDDGLPLKPVSSCQGFSSLSIPKCQGSKPGAVCIANKDECGIPTDLENCRGYHYSKKYSVYLKASGSTRTITTTTTVPFVFMVDDGPCTIQHGCVRSPGFPHADLKHESCQISLSPPADLRLVEFRNCALEPRPIFLGGYCTFVGNMCECLFLQYGQYGQHCFSLLMPRIRRGKNAQHKRCK